MSPLNLCLTNHQCTDNKTQKNNFICKTHFEIPIAWTHHKAVSKAWNLTATCCCLLHCRYPRCPLLGSSGTQTPTGLVGGECQSHPCRMRSGRRRCHFASRSLCLVTKTTHNLYASPVNTQAALKILRNWKESLKYNNKEYSKEPAKPGIVL